VYSVFKVALTDLPAAFYALVSCLSINRRRSVFYRCHGVTCGEYSCKLNVADCMHLLDLYLKLCHLLAVGEVRKSWPSTFGRVDAVLFICVLAQHMVARGQKIIPQQSNEAKKQYVLRIIRGTTQ